LTRTDTQIFRSSSPSSPSHDPFLPSPSSTQSHPHLRGGSRSPSVSGGRTPPFPGPGIDSLPDIDNDLPGPADELGSGIGIGLLFGDQHNRSLSQSISKPVSRNIETTKSKVKGKGKGRHMESSIPNPYSRSSSESEEDDEEIEPDLEEVDTMRRSLRASPATGFAVGKKKEPMSERAKKGWLAHQSIFPPSSSSSSETDESEKETEEESETDERVGMMGRSRRVKSKPRKEEVDDEDEEVDGYHISPSELQDTRRPQVPGDYLDEPLLGPDELDQVRTRGGNGKVPIRLQVYHGRFGHWEREGLRKYKDSGFLALWLTSIMAVLIGLLFVWGSTDVS